MFIKLKDTNKLAVNKELYFWTAFLCVPLIIFVMSFAAYLLFSLFGMGDISILEIIKIVISSFWTENPLLFWILIFCWLFSFFGVFYYRKQGKNIPSGFTSLSFGGTGAILSKGKEQIFYPYKETIFYLTVQTGRIKMKNHEREGISGLTLRFRHNGNENFADHLGDFMLVYKLLDQGKKFAQFDYEVKGSYDVGLFTLGIRQRLDLYNKTGKKILSADDSIAFFVLIISIISIGGGIYLVFDLLPSISEEKVLLLLSLLMCILGLCVLCICLRDLQIKKKYKEFFEYKRRV
jgi:hypothetical protein